MENDERKKWTSLLYNLLKIVDPFTKVTHGWLEFLEYMVN